MKRGALSPCLVWVALAGAAGAADLVPMRTVTLAERVAAREALERVYHEHRTWPAENPSSKPPLASILPRGLIEEMVRDDLRKSDALEVLWRRPITTGDLQAEVDRMVRNTKDPAVLGELLAALGHDPVLIAECLARPMLAARLLHTWSAYDASIHAAVRREAEEASRRLTIASFQDPGPGRYAPAVYRLSSAPAPSGAGLVPGAPAPIAVDAAELAGLCDELGPADGRVRVRETETAFQAYVVARADGQGMEVLFRTFPKESPSTWWGRVRGGFSDRLPAPTGHVRPIRRGAGGLLAPCDDWIDKANLAMPPSPRHDHTAVWTGSEMIVWGGDAGGPVATGGRYDPATDTWTPVSNAGAPAARRLHTAVWTGTEMIVWGGEVSATATTNTGGRYDPVADAWTSTSTSPPCASARTSHGAVWTGSEMVVWGGYDNVAYLDTGARYDPAADSWIALPAGGAPSPRAGHTTVWTGTEMIVWGGYAAGLDRVGGRWRLATNTWAPTAVDAGCPQERTRHTAVWTGSRMIVWGGSYGTTALDTGGRYDPVQDRWTATPILGTQPTPRYSHRAGWTGSEMLVWGGYGGATHPTVGGRYDPTTDTWTSMSAAGACPVGRTNHSLVWSGTEAIVWGGLGVGVGASGGRYSPVTDTWVATSTGGAIPSARWLHTTVWTGSELIVWGGIEIPALTTLATGARYRPSIDAWTATSDTGNCPTPRHVHTAVWTGSEMIVWGGDEGTALLDTGGRYAPASDTWIPTSFLGSCPSPRRDHTAVWSGFEMIVWGGTTPLGGGCVDTGGRYSTSLDTWLATPTGGACPAARIGHTAVWTGTEMIVWGGGNCSSPVNTGGRFSLSTGTWTATSVTGACPVPRKGHTAVWTGSEMIVWGGSDPFNLFNSGGRYSPSTGGWTPMTTASPCPSGRMGHTAVWLNGEMIVWGGGGSGPPTNTGGRYAPAWDSWVSTSTAGACPSPREGHRAVSTGTAMLVWGPDRNGGMYRPLVTIGPGALPGGVVGSAYGQTLTASGGTPGYTFAVTTGALPPGLALAGTTGEIGGVPTTAGTSAFAVSATDSSGCTGSRPFTIVVTCPVVTLSPPSLPAAVVGTAYTETLMATGGTAPHTFAVTSGSLPPGLSLGSASGVISGTPLTAGNASFTVTASDAYGCPGTQVYTIVTSCPSITVSPATLPGGLVGAAYAETISASGGTPPHTFARTAGAWPPGLALNASTGAISGTPTTAGSWSVTVTATDAYGCSGSRSYGVTISCPAVAVDPPSLPGGTAGTGYAQTLTASGGTPPHTFAVTSGALPAGLALNGTTGVLSGTPTTAGASSFTVTAADAYGCTGSRAYNVTIACPAIALTPPTLPGGNVGTPYGQTITASGGNAPYTFAVTAGTLPGGLTLSTGGVLSGTPTATGTFSFTVTATDGYGCTGAHPYSVTVAPAGCGMVVVSPADLPASDEGLAYAQTLTATGGTAPYTWAVTGGALPPGLALGTGSGVISGTPAAAGSHGFTVTATDASPNACTGSRAYVVDVASAVGHVLGEGLGPTNGNGVRVFTRSGTPAITSFSAYGSGQWGTNVASGDVNGAIYGEILTAPGPGGVYGPHVRAWLRDGTPVAKVSFYAYSTLKYGANVGAGRFDADGFDEILTGPGPGEVFGPHVRAFDFDNAALAAIAKVNFFAYGTLKYGVNVEEGSVDADAFAEILTGAGPGSVFAATAKGFNYDGVSLTAIAKINFNAFPTSFGVNVAGGDADGDGYAEIAATLGPAPTNLNGFAGFDYDGSAIAPAPGFTVTPAPTSSYGGRVGTGDVTGDGREELQCGAGRDPAAGSTVNVYGYTGAALVAVPPAFTPFTAAGYAYGVNIAGGGLGYF